MSVLERAIRCRAAVAIATTLAATFAVTLAAALAMSAGAAYAQDKTYVMKISTPTAKAAPDEFAKEYAEALEKDSGGRIKVEIYPANQLGSIPRQIEGTQFGSIQCSVIPPEFFVGIDERFEVLATPGLVDSVAQGQRLAADPTVSGLMLGLGADKGLPGVALFLAEQGAVLSKAPIRHLADFKGKKLRVFASQFQREAFGRLGVTPVAMGIGDVLPAIQQGTIDGAAAGVTVFNAMHFQDAAKYITTTRQPAIFLVAEVNRKWYESLPADLRKIVDDDAAKVVTSVNAWTTTFNAASGKRWVDGGGELIALPADEQTALMKTLASVGEDVSRTKPQVSAAYQMVEAAAQHVR